MVAGQAGSLACDGTHLAPRNPAGGRADRSRAGGRGGMARRRRVVPAPDSSSADVVRELPRPLAVMRQAHLDLTAPGGRPADQAGNSRVHARARRPLPLLIPPLGLVCAHAADGAELRLDLASIGPLALMHSTPGRNNHPRTGRTQPARCGHPSHAGGRRARPHRASGPGLRPDPAGNRQAPPCTHPRLGGPGRAARCAARHRHHCGR